MVTEGRRRSPRRGPRLAPAGTLLAVLLGLCACGCSSSTPSPSAGADGEVDQQAAATTDPKEPARERVENAPGPSGNEDVKYDTTVPKPLEPRDFLERISLDRGIDLIVIDLLYDADTEPPEFERPPPPPRDAVLFIAPGVPMRAYTDRPD